MYFLKKAPPNVFRTLRARFLPNSLPKNGAQKALSRAVRETFIDILPNFFSADIEGKVRGSHTLDEGNVPGVTFRSGWR